VALNLTRKQSMRLGLGLLAAFFLASGVTIYRRNNSRVPSVDGSTLSKEAIEGTSALTPQPVNPALTTGTPAAGVGFVLNDFHRSLVRDGKTVWEIHGSRGQYDPLNSKAIIEKPDLNVTRENGDTVHLTADRANLLLSGTQLSTAELYDNVVVVYKGNTTLTTSKALYDEQLGKVTIPVPLELDSPMFALKGNRAEALLDPQQIVVSNGVHSTIKARTK